ncbi:MAG: hypothetical protein KGZ25_10115, partial [Planctomycetes bacterium]|nr:hypothetical protein [Planctomycetota bacterium]
EICGPIDPLEDVSFDCLDFNRRTLLEKALSAGVEDQHEALRSLVEPQWVRADMLNAQDRSEADNMSSGEESSSHGGSFVADTKTSESHFISHRD